MKYAIVDEVEYWGPLGEYTPRLPGCHAGVGRLAKNVIYDAERRTGRALVIWREYLPVIFARLLGQRTERFQTRLRAL